MLILGHNKREAFMMEQKRLEKLQAERKAEKEKSNVASDKSKSE